MARRADPERIFQARRSAVYRRLTDESRMSEQMAAAWVDAWVAEADRQGIDHQDSGFWDGALPWVAAQRKKAGRA